MAIDLLVSGMSIAEAAERSGYTRQHLSRLIHNDVRFQAEYQRRLVEDHVRRNNFFWARYDQSGKVFKRSLDEGDPRTALEIFKLGSRGVTDIEHRDLHPREQDVPALPPPPPPQEEPRITSTSESSSLTCDDCGLVTKSRGGLTQHRKAKHRGEYDKP
jgi:hypothetical protein